MVTKTVMTSLAAFAALLMPAGANAATFVEGDTIRCSTSSQGASGCNGANISQNARTAVVSFSGAPEFTIGATPNRGSSNPVFTADFANGILTLRGIAAAARTFTGTTLTFAFTNGKIFTSAELISATNQLTQNQLSIRNGALDIKLNDPNTTWGNGTEARIRVGAIPEPGTWMLMILGLGAVGFAMRRRQKVSVRYQFA